MSPASHPAFVLFEAAAAWAARWLRRLAGYELRDWGQANRETTVVWGGCLVVVVLGLVGFGYYTG